MLKKTLVIGSAAAVMLLSLAFLLDRPAPAQQGGGEAKQVSEARRFLNTYCVGCHSERAAASSNEVIREAARKLKLDTLDVDNVGHDPERWELVVRKLRAGMMPPSGLPRPPGLEQFIVNLEDSLDRAAVKHIPPPGLHRLNRTEYAHAIEDLLGIKINPAKYLPSDDVVRGFDNIAVALTISPSLLEGYVTAAGKISRLAIGSITQPVQETYRAPEDTSQDYHIEGMPFGTRGGMIAEHWFPADGDYKMEIHPISKGNMGNTGQFGEIPGEKLEVLLDGERIKLLDWASDYDRRAGVYRVEFPATAGPHTVVVTFLATNYAPGSDLNKHFLRSTLETGGLPGFKFFPHVGKFVIDGPYNARGAKDTPARRKLFICTPANPSEETACARQIIANFARKAYRRPITDRDTETLLGFYQQGRNGGTFDSGIEFALRRILADPEFIFRKEAEPANLAEGQTYRISDLELASRLSFFIWSSVPDEELLTLAAQSRLHEPAVLEQQVKRMLADQRSERMVENFAGQWLGLRALRTQVPVANLYPDFDDNLRNAMEQEMLLFVNYIVQNDRPVTELLDANYTFVNERLAKHYGIPNIYGSNMRRIELAPEFDVRRGLLGKGSFLTVSSAPERTSPVNRGKYVMQMFLGLDPPAPPPNVEINLQANARDTSRTPTIREQMEMHRKNEPCLSCHKIMDPIGLSMENFTAIGEWRYLDGGTPIDPSGQLVDGTKLNGPSDLRNALVRYSPQFVRVATEKLLIYALGRGTEHYDMPLVRSIVKQAEANQYRFSSLVLGVVKSEPFQMNMKISQNAAPTREVAAR
jgi:hypothetical protein